MDQDLASVPSSSRDGSEDQESDDEESYQNRSSIDTSSIIEGKRKRKNISYYEGGPTVFYTKSQRKNKWGDISNRSVAGVAKKKRKRRNKYAGRFSLDGHHHQMSESGSVLAEDGSVISSTASNATCFEGATVPHTWPKKRRQKPGIIDDDNDYKHDDMGIVDASSRYGDELEKTQEFRKEEGADSSRDPKDCLSIKSESNEVERTEMRIAKEGQKKKKKRRSYNNIDRTYKLEKYDSEINDDDDLDESLFKASSGRKRRKKKRSKAGVKHQHNYLDGEEEEEEVPLVVLSVAVKKVKKQRRKKSNYDVTYGLTSDTAIEDEQFASESEFGSEKSVFAGYHGLKEKKAEKSKKRRSNVDATYRPPGDSSCDDDDSTFFNVTKRSRRKRRSTYSEASIGVLSNTREGTTPELLRMDQKPAECSIAVSAIGKDQSEQNDLVLTQLRESNRNGNGVNVTRATGKQAALTKTSTWFFIFSIVYAVVYLLYMHHWNETRILLSNRREIGPTQYPAIDDMKLKPVSEKVIKTEITAYESEIESGKESDIFHEDTKTEVMSVFLDAPEDENLPEIDVQGLVDESMKDLVTFEIAVGSFLHGVDVTNTISTAMKQRGDNLFQHEQNFSIERRFIDLNSVSPTLMKLRSCVSEPIVQRVLDSVSKMYQMSTGTKKDKIVDIDAFNIAQLKLSGLAHSTMKSLTSKSFLLKALIENILLLKDIIPQVDELSDESMIMELSIDQHVEDPVESVRILSTKTVADFAINVLEETNEIHDYASLHAGASLVHEGVYRTSQSLVDELPVGNRLLSFMGLKDYGRRPDAALSPSFGENILGQCWAFRKEPNRIENEADSLSGSLGSLVVQLSAPTQVEKVVIEHPPKHVTPRSESAIKYFRVIGFEDSECGKNPRLLGSFKYDIGKCIYFVYMGNTWDRICMRFKLYPRFKNFSQHHFSKFHMLPACTDATYSHQSFVVRDTDLSEEVVPKQSCIMLAVDSNWGYDYSCLYRFRVY